MLYCTCMKELVRIYFCVILAVIFSQPVRALDVIVLDIKNPIKMEIRETEQEYTNSDTMSTPVAERKEETKDHLDEHERGV